MISSFIKEFKRLLEALMGKWSLHAWREMMQSAANEMILDECKKNGSRYKNGKCVLSILSTTELSANIQLWFEIPDGRVSQLEARRTYPKKKFLSEVLAQLENQGDIEFALGSRTAT